MKTYLSFLSVCLAVASPSSALGQAESAAAAEGAGGQELRELHPGKLVTGTITVKMEGGTQVFLATSQQLAANLGGNIADPAAKAFAQKVATPFSPPSGLAQRLFRSLPQKANS